MGAEGVGDGPGLADALMPVDRGLHLRIEILHADADACQPSLGESVDPRGVEAARIDLHRELHVGGDAEGAAKRVGQPSDVGRGKHCRRTAAPMDVAHETSGGTRAPTAAISCSIAERWRATGS